MEGDHKGSWLYPSLLWLAVVMNFIQAFVMNPCAISSINAGNGQIILLGGVLFPQSGPLGQEWSLWPVSRNPPSQRTPFFSPFLTNPISYMPSFDEHITTPYDQLRDEITQCKERDNC